MAIKGTAVTGINRTTNVEYRAFEADNLFGEKYQEKQNSIILMQSFRLVTE